MRYGSYQAILFRILTIVFVAQYVEVQLHSGELDASFVEQFTAVVATDWPLHQRLQLNDICHEKGIRFIATETRGVFANIFCDFGDSFVVTDVNGEPPFEAIISAISQVSLAHSASLCPKRHLC